MFMNQGKQEKEQNPTNYENQEKQLFDKVLSELQARSSNQEEWASLIEEAEAMIQKYSVDESLADIGHESLAELYFLTANVIFANDRAVKVATRSKILANEEKCLEYYHRAIALWDKEEYSYELWNFLSTAGHREDGIAALEGFIERTGGTVKVLARAAEYILMYADSEDTKTIQKSVDYFYRAVGKEPDCYETYWSFFTDLEEAVEVCPWLLKETVFCLEKLIALSLPEESKNHDTLENRRRELKNMYQRIQEDERFFEAAKKGLMLRSGNEGDTYLAKAFFGIAHNYHAAGQSELAAKYYLAFDGEEMDNIESFVPQEYQKEYIFYHQRGKSLFERIRNWFEKIFKIK